MVSTGLRRGEVLGIRWADVDLELGRVSITQTVVVVANSAQLSEPKTASGRRTVYLHSSLTEVLKRRKAEQAGERLLAGSAWEDHGLVFTTALGTTIHPRNLSRDFHLAVRSAGVPSIRLHDLRHTAATLALTGGAHPKQVQEMLGHARVAITLDVYSHVGEQMHPRQPIGSAVSSSMLRRRCPRPVSRPAIRMTQGAGWRTLMTLTMPIPYFSSRRC
jgi:integrase